MHEHTALDLRHGVMSREIVVVDDQGRRTRIRQRRLASMAAPHIAALETRIIPENWSGRVKLRIALDGRVENTNVPTFAGLASQHLNVIETGCDGANLMWLVAETVNSKLRIAEVARTLIYQGGLEQRADRRTLSEPGFIGQGLEVDIGEGEEVVIDKCVAIFTSRDRAIAEPLVAAREEIAHSASFDDLLHAHAAAWHRLWQRFRVGLDDRDDMRLPVNVHIFHLLQTLSPHTADLDAGVPAAGLHGESYRGHIFWDELFVFPFLNFRLPELTRALLRYRHRRLPQARRRAASLGMKGALFPVGERQRRAGRNPTRVVEPARRSVAARLLQPAVPRQLRDRVQRVALLADHRRLRLPRLLRGGAALRGGPVRRQHRDLFAS